MHLSTFCALLLTLSSIQAWAAEDQAPSESVHHMEFARANRTSPRAAIGLWSLQTIRSLHDEKGRQQEQALYQSLATASKTPLAVKRIAARLQARMHRAAGQSALAKSLLEQQGWIRDWWVMGPLDNEARQGLDQSLALEKELDLDQSYQGKRQAISWRRYPLRPDNGRIRLHPIFLPNTGVAAYALTILDLDKKQTALFHLGCDDGCKLWVNGQELYSDPGPHPHRFDQQTLKLELPPGANRLLLKLSQDSSAMEFSLAVTDLKGRPLPGLRTPGDRSGLERGLAQAQPQGPQTAQTKPGLADWFQEQAQEHPDKPEQLAQAAMALYFTAAQDHRSRAAEQLLGRAIAHDQASEQDKLRWMMMMARLVDDENRAREWLIRAAQEHPKSAAPLARMGLHHQVRGETNRALIEYKKALKRSPEHLPSLIGLAELQSDLNLYALAEKQMAALVSRWPQTPEVLVAAGNQERKLGNEQKAKGIFRKLLTIDALDQLALRALHELALKEGDLKGALSYLDRLMAIDPLRQSWWLQRAQLLQANGQGKRALQTIDQACAICPADARPWLVRGEILLAQSRDGEALESMEQALALAPQDSQLQRRIRALAPSSEPFYSPWQIEPQELNKPDSSAAQASASGARLLLDSHVVKLHSNGMTSHFRQQVVKIEAARGARRFRTFQVEYAPGRQDVRILASRVWHTDGREDTGVMVDDYSLSEPWYNLYYDVHARQITFPELRPGDLVEVTTLVNDVGPSALLGDYFGDLVSLKHPEPLQRFSYVLLSPADQTLRFNNPGQQVKYSTKKGDQGEVIHSWQAHELAAVELEPNMPGFTETHAFLHLSTFPDWTSLGSWFFARIEDQLVAGPDVRKLAQELTQGKDKPLDKIRAIYRFVADNTRYVGLEFGIHSYVPYQASQVFQRKYGDCKDKSALLVALLGEVNIPARLALVRMNRLGRIHGPGSADGDQPASLAVFNHAIAYLPDQDLWLDGTAALHDISDLPAQDQGVQALVVEPKGGRLLKTPTTGAERNWTRLEFDFSPRPDGSSRLNTRLSVSGTLAPEMRMRFLGGKPAAVTFGVIVEELFSGAKVEQAEVEQLTQPAEPFAIKAQIEIPKLGQVTAGGLDVPILGKDTSYQRMLASEQSRTHDLIMGPGWAVRWRVKITPPPAYSQALLPPPGKLVSPFGQAELSLTRQAGRIEVKADFSLKGDRIPVAQYPQFREFLGKVDRLFSKRVTLNGADHAS